MWLYTDEGLLSIVKFDPKDDTVKRSKREIKSWGKDPKLVRARVKADLEQIRPFYSKLRIDTDGSADYKYRAIVPALRMAEFVASKMMEIDYTSHFKEVCLKRAPQADKRYAGLTGAWSAFSQMQDTAPYAGLGTKWYDYRSTGTSKYGTGAVAPTTPYVSDYGYVFNPETKTWESPNKRVGATITPTKATKTTYTTPVTGTVVDAQVVPEGDEYNELDEWLKKPTDKLEGMCAALVMYAPQEIDVDAATPSMVYDFWARADNEYNRPLSADEVYALLTEAANDTALESKWTNAYEEMLCKLDSAWGFTTDDVAEQVAKDVQELIDN